MSLPDLPERLFTSNVGCGLFLLYYIIFFFHRDDRTQPGGDVATDNVEGIKSDSKVKVLTYPL